METNLWDLPPEILSLIKSRVFAGDCRAFSSACTYFRSIPILIRQPPPPMTCPFSCCPWLMFIQRNNGMTMLSHPLYNDFYCVDIPQLYDAKILSSKYGWLLMTVNSSIFFFNPLTGEKIELPTINKDFTSASFNSPPTSNDCLVVGFGGINHALEIGLLRRGQQNWDICVYGSLDKFFCASSSPILFNGLYFVLDVFGSMGALDLNKQSWKVYVKPFEVEFQYSFCRNYLLELDGKVVAVFISFDNKVYFFSLDLTKMTWQSEESIGDKMLYVSSGSSFSKRATMRRTSNKIYFPIFRGKKCLFYSLKTKKFHSFDDDHSNKSRELRLSAWIEPTFEHYGQLTW